MSDKTAKGGAPYDLRLFTALQTGLLYMALSISRNIAGGDHFQLGVGGNKENIACHRGQVIKKQVVRTGGISFKHMRKHLLRNGKGFGIS